MNAHVADRRWSLSVRLMIGAAVWSIGLLLTGLLLPVYDSSTSSADGITLTRQTLVENDGLSALVLILIPSLCCAAVAWAMLARRRDDPRWSTPGAWVAVGVVAVEAVLGILSIGAFILPVAIALALAVFVAPPWADVRRPAPRVPGDEPSGRELATGA
ncbi:MAG: hypothetical protein WBQ18_13210 [Solirubrobacteraceae bacterium]